jgi:hypothetical protein
MQDLNEIHGRIRCTYYPWLLTRMELNSFHHYRFFNTKIICDLCRKWSDAGTGQFLKFREKENMMVHL